MNYGNEPVYDLQASSYAYKMRIWLNDQIWNVKIMCIPSISNNLYNCTFVIQNPVDPAGPDCYRIDIKPC